MSIDIASLFWGSNERSQEGEHNYQAAWIKVAHCGGCGKAIRSKTERCVNPDCDNKDKPPSFHWLPHCGRCGTAIPNGEGKVRCHNRGCGVLNDLTRMSGNVRAQVS